MLATARKWAYVCGAVKVSELALPDEGVKPEARFFTPEQVRQIIALAEQPFRTMFCVVAMTGIRSVSSWLLLWTTLILRRGESSPAAL